MNREILLRIYDLLEELLRDSSEEEISQSEVLINTKNLKDSIDKFVYSN